MARRYAYWVNFQFKTRSDSGESAGEYILTSQLTHGRQVVDLGEFISDNKFGGKATVVVRTFQLLREE